MRLVWVSAGVVATVSRVATRRTIGVEVANDSRVSQGSCIQPGGVGCGVTERIRDGGIRVTQNIDVHSELQCMLPLDPGNVVCEILNGHLVVVSVGDR